MDVNIMQGFLQFGAVGLLALVSYIWGKGREKAQVEATRELIAELKADRTEQREMNRELVAAIGGEIKALHIKVDALQCTGKKVA